MSASKTEIVGVTEFNASVDRLYDGYRKRVRATVQRLLYMLQTLVKEDKLSGQVLNARTGRLRRSVNVKLEETQDSIEGFVGTNVSYGRRWELGYSGDEAVRAHMRTAKQAFGRMIKNPHAAPVRAHVRHLKIAPRSFLQSAMRDMSSTIQSELTAAMKE